MGYGSSGRILRVDLTRGTCDEQVIDEATYRLYPGGKALAGYLLLRELPADVDPLSPQNLLVFANGLLTGANVSTASRFTVAARSPLTLAYGESEAGGYWGPELKMAGFEAIVVSGRAAQPSYLSIVDGVAALRPAAHLWGRDPHEVEEAVRAELGDRFLRVLQIGRAGENQVRYAALVNELTHFNGRTGMGAVMGSKNLKAIAVRGRQRYAQIARNPKPIGELGKALSRRVADHPQAWDMQDKGTPGLVDALNAAGMLPTRNFREGVFEGVEKLGWKAYESEILVGRGTCYSCSVRCKREVEVTTGAHRVERRYGGPEYETLQGFGGLCGVDDLQVVAYANERCNRHVLDTISTASTIAFAMECFEHGLIDARDTDGLELRFGNAQAMLEMIERIARREGFGDLLSHGTRHAARVIGRGAERYAIQVKGQELPMHDPRGKVGVGIGYAVGECGADHLYAVHDTLLANPKSISFQAAQPLGVECLPALELGERKARNYAILENWSSFGKVVGLCFFGPAPRSFLQIEEVLALVRAATGWEIDLDELLTIGERATNLARAFNVRAGLGAADDRMPERLFDALPEGPLAGKAISRDEFNHTLQALYRIKGWNPDTTAPTRERLRRLDIEWVADLVEG